MHSNSSEKLVSSYNLTGNDEGIEWIWASIVFILDYLSVDWIWLQCNYGKLNVTKYKLSVGADPDWSNVTRPECSVVMDFPYRKLYRMLTNAQ